MPDGLTGLTFGDLVRLEPVAITFPVGPCIAAAVTGRRQLLLDILIGGPARRLIARLQTLSNPFKTVRPLASEIIAILVLLEMYQCRRPIFAREM